MEEFIDDINAAIPDAATVPVEGVLLDVPAAADKDQSSSTSDADASKKATGSESEVTSPASGDASSVEELASQLGWNKDHKGADAVDAATYILRSKDIQKTMKEHNKDLKNQLEGVKGAVDALKDHNDRVYQTDLKRMQSELAALKKEKKAAVELADVDKVDELDKQIEDVQKDIAKPIKTAPKIHNPTYDAWIEDNGWYLTDDAMAQYADKVADQYAGAPLERVYSMVRQKVAEVFPEKFAAAAPAAPARKVDAPASPVESGGRKADTANFTKADLSPEQTSIMNQFVRSGIMTEAQYIADIAKMQ